MRVSATPYHGSIGIEADMRDSSRSGVYSAVIPIAGVVCLCLWVLAIWEVVDLVGA